MDTRDRCVMAPLSVTLLKESTDIITKY